MVIVQQSRQVTPREYPDTDNVRHVKKRTLIGPHNGAPNFSMRRFTVGSGGCSPYHTHPWEHEVYVLSGRGEVRFSGGSREVETGDFVYVPPNDEHQFVNAGTDVFEFLCMVPLEGEDG